MKHNLISLAFFFLLIPIFISCSSDNTDKTENEKDSVIMTDTTRIIIQPEDSIKNDTGKEEKETIIVFKYICPQGDKEGNSDKAGICLKCEMELIENPDFITK